MYCGFFVYRELIQNSLPFKGNREMKWRESIKGADDVRRKEMTKNCMLLVLLNNRTDSFCAYDI
jgi:hypothetical protein